jgi:hypothetical protein
MDNRRSSREHCAKPGLEVLCWGGWALSETPSEIGR